MVRYLIAGPKRSGTTVAQLLLQGHPQVSGFRSELSIDPLFTQGIYAYSVGKHMSEADRKHGRLRLFEAITGAHSTSKTTALGAKIAYGSAKKARMVVDALQLDMPDLKVILLNRSDLAAHYGSLVKSRETGIAHSWRPGWTGKASSVKLNRHLFAKHAMSVLDSLKEIRRLKQTHAFLEVSYEALSADIDAQYRRMLDFLDLPYVVPDWLQSKKVLPQPEEYIVNYRELVELQKRIEEGVSPRRRLALRFYGRVFPVFANIRRSLIS